MSTICIDARLIKGGGIGTLLRAVIEEGIIREHLKLYLLASKEDREFVAKYGCEIYEIKSKIYSIKEQFELFFRIPKCSLFWSPHFNVPFFPIRAKKRLATIHDVYHLAHFHQLTLMQKIYAKLLYNATNALSHHVTTVSTFSQKEIEHHCYIQPKKFTVIPLGTPSNFAPAPSKDTLQKYGLQHDSYLLAVGNLKPHKNLQILVAAFSQLEIKEKLVIVGKKENFHTTDVALFEMAKQSHLRNRIHFLGYVEDCDLPTLYSHASLFVFPSCYEGFGIPPLEAMACGCPVLASTSASIPEVCGNAVEYFNPYDVRALADKIQLLLKNPDKRNDLIKKGFQHSQSRFLKESAKKFIDLMENMMS